MKVIVIIIRLCQCTGELKFERVGTAKAKLWLHIYNTLLLMLKIAGAPFELGGLRPTVVQLTRLLIWVSLALI